MISISILVQLWMRVGFSLKFGKFFNKEYFFKRLGYVDFNGFPNFKFLLPISSASFEFILVHSALSDCLHANYRNFESILEFVI